MSQSATRKAEIQTGIVIISGTIVFFLFALGLSSFDDFFSKKQTIKVYFSDVQGLKTGDPVQVMGLERGNVKSIRVVKKFDEQKSAEIPIVEVSASFFYEEKLPNDTQIKIDRSLTGSTVLKVIPGIEKQIKNSASFQGTEEMALKEMQTKFGEVMNKFEKFILDLTSKNISTLIKNNLENIGLASKNISNVSQALNKALTSKKGGLTEGINNFYEFLSIFKNKKEKLMTTIDSLSSSSQNVDQLIKNNKNKINTIVKNLEKTSANVKVTSREVKWQPWILLKDEDDVSIQERGLYNSALEFAEGAEALNEAARQLKNLNEGPRRSPASLPELNSLMLKISKKIKNLTQAQDEIWEIIHKQ